jgi:hypothetical protein
VILRNGGGESKSGEIQSMFKNDHSKVVTFNTLTVLPLYPLSERADEYVSITFFFGAKAFANIIKNHITKQHK